MKTRPLLHLLRRRLIHHRIWTMALAAAGALFARMADGASPDFTLYVANSLGYGSGTTTRYFTVEEFDSQGNASVFATNSSFANPILNTPISVALDSSGSVYVVCSQDNTWIEKFDPWGNHAARFVNATVGYPGAMVFDGSGNLYVAAGLSDNITKYDPLGNPSVFAGTNIVGDLVGLAFDAAGNLYASDEYNGLIRKIDTRTNLTTFASPGNNPYGLAFDSAGNLYAALRGSGNIVKYTSGADGTPGTNASIVASLGGSTQPVGLAFDPAGNLYVSEYAADRIVKIDAQTNVTVFATTGLNGPAFIALQPKLYRVDRFVVAGGGGTSSGGIWTVSGTAGQADAGIMSGQFMSGELVGVEGGFWAGPVTNQQIVSSNLLVNGSFELGSFVNGHGGDNFMQLYPGAINILGWTVTGTAGYDLGWGGPNDDLGLAATDGGYFLDLTGYHDSPPYDGVSQTVPTIIGQTYDVSFEIGYSPGYDPSPPAVSVTATGQPAATYTFVVSGAKTWETFGFSFTASASDTTLTFTGATTQSVSFIGLDNVIMTAATASPVFAMGMPAVAGGQVTLPFAFTGGSASTFELLQSAQLDGLWVTNTSAMLTTNAPGGSYSFIVRTSGAAEFYRVQSH